MTTYLTKVWSFGVPAEPLTFGADGWRRRAREQLKPGDLVVLVGTKAHPTAEADRGLLLGIKEPTTEPVRSLDFDVETRPEYFDENKQYRLPFGLLIRRAWRLIDRPSLEEMSDRAFAMDSVSGLVELTDDEAAKVAKLRREEVPVLEPSVRARGRIEGFEAGRRMIAPPPTTMRRGIMHLRSAPAYTYAMQIVGPSRPCFKIGWAFDFKLRARQFNQAAMPEIGGLRYRPSLNHLWDTARQAYGMEQRLLDHFRAHRHSANHEILHDVIYKTLEAVWIEFVRRPR
jgi:hypothetical protein